ncbi:chemotaxis protein CheW [Synechococcus sp. PCC 7336]|uniref:chemotaxis protein CheW n=1 Tax=Synechococcus sp. PCC 7336 TaxID=195250 RepID=UPI000345954A|nr:chemotaxis protein CheW [Synechococcus sp. PCC 7336]
MTATSSPPANPRAAADTANRSIRTIAFQLGSLDIALRIEAVQRVFSRVPIYSSGTNSSGVAHVNAQSDSPESQQEVVVFDLHRYLFGQSLPLASPELEAPVSRYLLVAKSPSGQSCGIPLEQEPSLMELPLSSIRQLPETYRQADTLGIASHVATSDRHGRQQTVFLLDMDAVLTLLPR